MFGLTKREQRWKAEQKAAETLIPLITAITVEAMKGDDKDAEITRLRDQLHLAEVARAAQVEGAVQVAAGWRERANQLEAQVAGLRKALAAAIRQNEHDMLMTGEELRAARAALGDKTPNE